MAQPDPHTSASGSPCAAPGSQTLCKDGFRAEVLAIPFPNGYQSWMCRRVCGWGACEQGIASGACLSPNETAPCLKPLSL